MTKICFFKKVDFEFSPTTKLLIEKIFQKRWAENFDHDIDYKKLYNVWSSRSIIKEITGFLTDFGLDTRYAGINFFSSNTLKKEKTNPHIDVLHRNSKFLPIKSRFNIKILGSEDTMFWWGHFKWGDQRHIEKTFYHNDIPYQSLSIPGDSITERWSYLGNPTETQNNLLCSSSFVNTEYAHALEISPGPRLIVSIPFRDPLEKLFP